MLLDEEFSVVVPWNVSFFYLNFAASQLLMPNRAEAPSLKKTQQIFFPPQQLKFVKKGYRLRNNFTSTSFCFIGTSSKSSYINWESSLTPRIKPATCTLSLISVLWSVAIEYASIFLDVSVDIAFPLAKSFTCSVTVWAKKNRYFKRAVVSGDRVFRLHSLNSPSYTDHL